MKTYQLIDGTIIEGKNAHELVRSMAQRKFVRVANYAKYRAETADIISEIYEVTINPETDDTFIATLVGSHLLEEIDTAKQL